MLAACTTFTACNSDESSLPTAGNQLQLSFGINAPESRAIFTDTKLPDSSPVGVRLDGYAYYANLVYTGSTTGSTQSWSSTTSVTLTDTKGTLYAYWPQNNAVSIDAINVDMTAADQTDWLYATPVTDVNEDKASVAVTMNHALANINVSVNKGSYLGAGNITNITVQSDGIALGGTFNAAQTTPGYTAFEDEGKPLSRTVSTTAGGAATDIMVVPIGTSATITFLATIDGIQFTATSAAVTLEKGNSYQYTLNLSDISTYMTIGAFSVNPWGTVTKDNLDLDVYDEFDEGIVATYYVDEASLTSRSAGVEVQLLSSDSNFKLSTIDRMKVDGVEVTPSLTYTFTSAGNHTVKYLLKDNTQVPRYMFYKCKALTAYKLPETVTTIDYGAFQECSGLKCELVIPNAVTVIEDRAFKGCSGLTGELIIPNSVRRIEESIFEGCTGLTGTLTIPEKVSYIGKYAFQECSGLTGELIIPNSVNMIEQQAFWGCTGLTGTLTIPNSVRTVFVSAFKGCSGLTELIIESGVSSISNDAFANCSGLQSIKVDANNLYYDSRNNCNAIMETATNTLVVGCNNTIIPEDCLIIGQYAFQRCKGLTGTLTIPNSVQTIGQQAFQECSGLTGTLTIPNSVTTIGDSAFGQCTGLTEITIGSAVTTIRNRAFAGCTGLTTLNLGDGVQTIGSTAFKGCTGLTAVTIPNSVQTIETSAFAECTGMTEITIGSAVTTIGQQAFYKCTGMTSITSLATTAPSVHSESFRYIKKGGTLYFPEGASGYDAWMSTSSYYLGQYNWTMQTISE